MSLLKQKMIELAEKKKHHPHHAHSAHHVQGTAVVHKKTGDMGVVSGPHFIGGGYGWYPVTTGGVETSWHDNDTMTGEAGESASTAAAEAGGDSDDAGGDAGGGDSD